MGMRGPQILSWQVDEMPRYDLLCAGNLTVIVHRAAAPIGVHRGRFIVD